MSETSPVSWVRENALAVITVDQPPVNALSHAVRAGIFRCLDEIESDTASRGAVIHCSGRTFIAGADITEFGTPKATASPTLGELCQRLDEFSKPTVAAIHGTALGGGLELALSCNYRVGHREAKVGLPEVNLGLLPGAGGTQRLPRVAGAEAALEMITSGKPINAGRAAELGILDAVDDDLLRAATTFADNTLKDEQHPRLSLQKVSELPDDFFASAEASVQRKARGREAPMKILACVRAAVELPFAEGLKFERERFEELYSGPQRQAMIHQFFAQRQAAKIPGLDPAAAPADVKTVGVIGAGTMGGGISMCLADAGINTVLVDRNDEAIAKGLATIKGNYDRSVQRGSRSQGSVDDSLALIRATTEYSELADADLVIEAAFEDMDIKKSIFDQLEAVVSEHAVLASNTSALDLDEIAATTKHPERVVGMHFFSPANVMRLLENVRAEKSSDAAVATIMALGKRLKKVPVLAGNCDGFIGNRMYQFYMYGSEFLVEEGATPEQVDGVMEAFGFAMGPLAVRDLSGVDVGWSIKKARLKDLPSDERYSPILERLFDAGRLGQKTSAGIYRYEGRKRIADPAFAQMVSEVVAEFDVQQRTFTDDEIVSQLLHPLVNEGARVLQDGVAQRSSDIDVVYVNGYGFPIHKGGPMFWAQQEGLEKVVETCERTATANGSRWAPCELLIDRARSGEPWD